MGLILMVQSEINVKQGDLVTTLFEDSDLSETILTPIAHEEQSMKDSLFASLLQGVEGT